MQIYTGQRLYYGFPGLYEGIDISGSLSAVPALPWNELWAEESHKGQQSRKWSRKESMGWGRVWGMYSLLSISLCEITDIYCLVWLANFKPGMCGKWEGINGDGLNLFQHLSKLCRRTNKRLLKTPFYPLLFLNSLV